MKIVVCDSSMNDAKQAMDIVKNTVKNNDYEVKVKSPQDVYVAVEEELLNCDIIILAIKFEDEQFDGIDLGRLINEKLPVCQIIYLTGIIEFAPLVYETRHCYFVMKNNMQKMLPRAIIKAIDSYNESVGYEILEFLSNGHKVFLAQKDIKYIERNDRLLIIHATKKSYPCYTSLKKLDIKLLPQFARCHGGFIVNLAFCNGMEKFEVSMSDGQVLPIGKSFYEEFKNKYLKFYS